MRPWLVQPGARAWPPHARDLRRLSPAHSTFSRQRARAPEPTAHTQWDTPQHTRTPAQRACMLSHAACTPEHGTQGRGDGAWQAAAAGVGHETVGGDPARPEPKADTVPRISPSPPPTHHARTLHGSRPPRARRGHHVTSSTLPSPPPPPPTTHALNHTHQHVTLSPCRSPSSAW